MHWEGNGLPGTPRAHAGAAVGGSLLGNLGDRIGRSRAMGVSVLFYSLFAGLGGLVRTPEQMLLLRFMVGLGVGGVWPNGVALVAECWPNTSRPMVSGILGAGINVGILALSLLGRSYPITVESWRWIFLLATLPTMLGLVIVMMLPESPKWLATRVGQKQVQRRRSKNCFVANCCPDTTRDPARVGAVGWGVGRKQVDDSVGRPCEQRYSSRIQVDDPTLVGGRGRDWQLSRCANRGLDWPSAVLFFNQPWRDGTHLGNVSMDCSARAVVLADCLWPGSCGDFVFRLVTFVPA